MMRRPNTWWLRQKSVGFISSHVWRLPSVIAICILMYALPLSLAVTLEPQGLSKQLDQAC